MQILQQKKPFMLAFCILTKTAGLCEFSAPCCQRVRSGWPTNIKGAWHHFSITVNKMKHLKISEEKRKRWNHLTLMPLQFHLIISARRLLCSEIIYGGLERCAPWSDARFKILLCNQSSCLQQGREHPACQQVTGQNPASVLLQCEDTLALSVPRRLHLKATSKVIHEGYWQV